MKILKAIGPQFAPIFIGGWRSTVYDWIGI